MQARPQRGDSDAEYTSVDLNTNATTTVYAPASGAVVHGVRLVNGGSTAVVQLELTDGSSTVNLTPGQSGGGNIAFTDPIALDEDDTLQVNVTTVEGSAQTNTAVVFRTE